MQPADYIFRVRLDSRIRYPSGYERPLLAVQRPPRLNASGLMVDCRSSTLSGRSRYRKAALQRMLMICTWTAL